MNAQIFSVFDSVAKRFLPPFFAPSIGEALRSFQHICNEEGHAFNRDATDYSLFHLGDFDAETGEIKGLSTPHVLGLAASFVAGSLQLEAEA